MLHQLVATICGITLQTQVNACRVTLQQATIEYNVKIEQKVQNYKQQFYKEWGNEYTASIFYVGKVVYDRQISFTYGRQSFSARQGGFNWKWQLTF